jgi:hypothetical protein
MTGRIITPEGKERERVVESFASWMAVYLVEHHIDASDADAVTLALSEIWPTPMVAECGARAMEFARAAYEIARAFDLQIAPPDGGSIH